MNRATIYILSIIFMFLQLSAAAQSQIDGSIMHDGLERTYILNLPESYVGSEPIPLVLNFHGLTSNAFDQMVYADLRSIGNRENFIVVQPQGTLNNAGEPYWNAQFDPTGVDDIGFTSALIDSLSANYAIDINRVYSTGMSNGGFMSYTLACELSDKIAAVASVTGSMTRQQTGFTCSPEHLCPIMQIHGTDDSVVLYEGSQFLAGTDEVMTFWANQNGCNTTPEILPIENTVLDDDSTAERQLYTDCDKNSTIELFKVYGGTHTWPGSQIKFGVTNCDMNASEEIWRFFSQYNLDGTISKSEEEVLSENILLYPSEVHHKVHLEFPTAIERTCTLLSSSGHRLTTENFEEKEVYMNVDNFSNGIYYMEIVQGNRRTTLAFTKI